MCLHGFVSMVRSILDTCLCCFFEVLNEQKLFTKNSLNMKFLTAKTSEVPFWQVLLAMALVGFVATWLYDMVWTSNVVTTKNGDFIKKSIGPLSTEARTAASASYEEKVLAKDAK